MSVENGSSTIFHNAKDAVKITQALLIDNSEFYSELHIDGMPGVIDTVCAAVRYLEHLPDKGEYRLRSKGRDIIRAKGTPA